MRVCLTLPPFFPSTVSMVCFFMCLALVLASVVSSCVHAMGKYCQWHVVAFDTSSSVAASAAFLFGARQLSRKRFPQWVLRIN